MTLSSAVWKRLIPTCIHIGDAVTLGAARQTLRRILTAPVVHTRNALGAVGSWSNTGTSIGGRKLSTRGAFLSGMNAERRSAS